MRVDELEDGADRMPSLVIDAAYYERLRGFARLAMRDAPEVAQCLLEELERADVVPSDQMPSGVVTVGSLVTYQDGDTGAVRTVRVVLPSAIDLTRQCVSVASPLGAGLIGLSVGQVIYWQIAERVRRLRVLGVRRD